MKQSNKPKTNKQKEIWDSISPTNVWLVKCIQYVNIKEIIDLNSNKCSNLAEKNEQPQYLFIFWRLSIYVLCCAIKMIQIKW